MQLKGMPLSFRLFLSLFFLLSVLIGVPGAGLCQKIGYGELKEDVPLDHPYYNRKYVGGWVSNLALDVMSINFTNIDISLNVAKKNFTNEGYKKFYEDMDTSGLLRLIEDSKMTILSAPIDQPKFIYAGIVNGRYQWAFEVPVVLTLQTAKKTIRESRNLFVVVVRSNEMRHHMIAVEDWILSDADWVPDESPASGLMTKKNKSYLTK